MRKISRRDIVFVALMLLLISFLGVLLHRNYSRRSIASEGAIKAGFVQYKYHVVQRKFIDRLIWEDVDSKTVIYLYDSVLTHDKSDAVITLENGFRLELDPDSMVEIDLIGDRIGVSLKSGSVRADGGQGNSFLKTGDGLVFDLKKSSVKIKTSDKGTEVEVRDGRPTVELNGEKTKLEKGKILEYKGNLLTIRESLYSLDSPRDGSVFLAEGSSRPVLFSASKNQNRQMASETILLSVNSDLSKAETYPLAPDTRLSLEEGTYYWRIIGRASDGKEFISSTSMFRIQKREIIRPYYPGNGELVQAERGDLTFAWEESEFANEYEFELAKDESFSDVVLSERVPENRKRVENLSEGTYYWRVRPYLRGNDSDLSVENKNTLTLKHGNETQSSSSAESSSASSTSSTLARKKSSSSVSSSSSSRSPNAENRVSTFTEKNILQPGDYVENPQPGVPVQFVWAAREGSTYNFSLFATEKGSEPLVRSRVLRAGEISFTGLPPGTYRMEIQETLADGKVSGRAVRSFILDYPLPKPPTVKEIHAQ